MISFSLISNMHCRNHPLFTIDDRANFILEQSRCVSKDLSSLSERVEQELKNGTEFPGQSWGPEQHDVSLDGDSMNKEMEQIYAERNAAYKQSQMVVRIRELCKLISDNSYQAKDLEVSEQCCNNLLAVHSALVASLSSENGIPSLSGKDLKYKTLKELSRPEKFKGRDVELIAKRRKTRRRNYGDLMGILNVNRTISNARHENEQLNQFNAPKIVRGKTSKQWVMDESPYNSNGLKLESLDLAEPVYVSEDTKEALLNAITDSQKDELNFDLCKYYCSCYHIYFVICTKINVPFKNNFLAQKDIGSLFKLIITQLLFIVLIVLILTF